jgi:hypothetical protein
MLWPCAARRNLTPPRKNRTPNVIEQLLKPEVWAGLADFYLRYVLPSLLR